MRWKILSILLLIIVIAAYVKIRDLKDEIKHKPPGFSFEGYTTEKLSDVEKEEIFNVIAGAKGIKYFWGGQSLEQGFDCSGLIVWSFGKVGYTTFRHQDRLLADVNANSMYLYNSIEYSPNVSVHDIDKGDWIFFDADKDGVMEHVSIFSHVDGGGDIWGVDAYSVVGTVAVRKVENFELKNPRFAAPKRVISIYFD